MKKALLIASVPSMIAQFNMDNIKILQNLGYEVSVATNFNHTGTLDQNGLQELKQDLSQKNIQMYQIDFSRGIGTINGNIKCYRSLRKYIFKNKFNLIHCHSPIGGAIGRLASKGSTAKVIYTAHGFQFFDNGPVKDWILFYPIEKFLSKYSNAIITINNEDYKIAKKFRKRTSVYKVPGVGIDFDRYQTKVNESELIKIKKDLAIPMDAMVLISIGELSSRKNHITAIRAISRMDKNIYYLICGVGSEKKFLIDETIKLGLEDRVIFLGYVNDILPILKVSDVSIFLSKREGLGLAGLESMAAGLPLISSEIGGIKDYTQNGKTGFTQKNPVDYLATEISISKLFSLDKIDIDKIRRNNKKIASRYDKKIVNEIMYNIYKDI